VVVGNKHGIDARYVPSVLSQPLLGPAAADPGVEQQPDAGRFRIDAVAIAAGLEGYDSHGRILPHGRRS